MGIKSTDTPATSLEPMFWPDITTPLVTEPLAETHKLPDPYSNMDTLVDELETAILKAL